MVEAKSRLQGELNAAILKAIEAEFKAQVDNLSFQGEEYEELKMRVKSKIVVASRALADVVSLLRDF